MKEINIAINQYIIENWLCEYRYPNGSYKYSQFAVDHLIEEKLVRKIVKNKNYSMTIETLEKLCEAKNITLARFFEYIKR